MTDPLVAIMADALETQHAAFLDQPESFDNREAIAAFLVATVRADPRTERWLAERLHDAEPHARPHTWADCREEQPWLVQAAAILNGGLT
jgi:hypothetical protein